MGAEREVRAAAICRATAVRELEPRDSPEVYRFRGQGAGNAPSGRVAEMRRGWACVWRIRLFRNLSGGCVLE